MAELIGEFWFVPYPAWGHLNPMLPVIERLVQGGDTVRVLAGTEFVAAVEAVGAQAVPLGHGFVPRVPPGIGVANRTRNWLKKYSAARSAATVLDGELQVQRPDVVVFDTIAAWAGRVARRWSVPSVPFSTTFLRRHGGSTPVLVHATPELQPRLAGEVRVLGPLIRTADIGTPWHAAPASKMLLVSPGTVFEREPAFFRMVIEAFAATDWRVVLATGAVDPALLGTLPANVEARRQVPQLELLRRSTVFLTHAGMNSVLEGLSASVPMVFAPRSREQRAIARRLAKLGAGAAMPTRCRPEVLRALVDHVATDHGTRQAVAGLQARLPADGAGVAAAVLRRQAGVSGRARNTDVMSTSTRAASVNSSTADDRASA